MSEASDSTSTRSLSESSTRTIPQGHSINSRLTIALPYLHLPILLGLPFYYISRASDVIHYANACTADGIGPIAWISPSEIATGSIELRPYNVTIYSNHRYPPPIPLVLPTPLELPESLLKLQAAWVVYIDSRVAEWKVSFTVACLFITVSLSMFQIPQAADDPLVRTFASFAVCRAFVGVISAPVFSLIFRNQYTRTARFAYVWSKGQNQTVTSIFWNPWVMLSLPAACTIWAVIFYILAFLIFICRVIDLTSTYQPPPMALALILRVFVIITSLSDAGCLFGIWLTLKRYRALYLEGTEEGV